MTTVRLALAQINVTVGDLSGNADKILAACGKASDSGADIVLFPEMVLTGYPPEDLLLRPRFVKDSVRILHDVARRCPKNLTSLIGFVDRTTAGIHDAAALVSQRRIRAVYHKQHLPNYGVFDEKRYFTPGGSPLVFSLADATFGVTVCEDIWVPKGPALAQSREGAQVILNLSASPYHAGKLPLRIKMLRSRAKECRAFVVYCNLVGGQDELVFDGGSLVLDPNGRVIAQAPQFDESLLVIDVDVPRSKRVSKLQIPTGEYQRSPIKASIARTLPEPEEIYSALVLGTRDYLHKNGFRKAVLGLSGGIDSALVACIAADALGSENVTGVTMPSRFNVTETQSDAQIIARNLDIAFHSLAIQPIVDTFLTTLQPLFAELPHNLAEENLQARIRGTMLMALSNKFGWLVLTTGNKSEMSVGYCTLYGDTAGGFAVIKDIPKTMVYRLCQWRNEKAGREIIPASVFDRAPSAELRPNQTDQDSLPPYDVLDNIIHLYVETDKSATDILRAGFDPIMTEKVVRLVDSSEYKRRQVPPGVKITPKAFGRDRRMPLTNKYLSTKPLQGDNRHER